MRKCLKLNVGQWVIVRKDSLACYTLASRVAWPISNNFASAPWISLLGRNSRHKHSFQGALPPICKRRSDSKERLVWKRGKQQQMNTNAALFKQGLQQISILTMRDPFLHAALSYRLLTQKCLISDPICATA